MIEVMIKGENLTATLTMDATDFIEIMHQPEVKLAGKRLIGTITRFGDMAEQFVKLLAMSKTKDILGVDSTKEPLPPQSLVQ